MGETSAAPQITLADLHHNMGVFCDRAALDRDPDNRWLAREVRKWMEVVYSIRTGCHSHEIAAAINAFRREEIESTIRLKRTEISGLENQLSILERERAANGGS
jgi:hypothetical protein